MEQFTNGTEYKRNHIGVLVTTIIIILALSAAAFWVWQGIKPKDEGLGNAAKDMLYEVLANAAGQQRIKVGMYRETFAGKADADSGKNIGSIASSVSEVDTEAGKFRSVFATNILEDDGFSVGRCIDDVTYSDYYQAPAVKTERAKSLADAASRLRLMPEGNLYKVTQPLRFITCPHLGLLPASPPMAMSRLSDGVFPVTLSAQQAKVWKEEAAKADLFEVKDEGTVERGGATLRKISFEPKDDGLSVNKKLYDIFYRAGEIAKIKSEQPRAEVDYEFQAINPNNTGGIEGFYLVDEAKRLPVYSELRGINPDKRLGESAAAGRNIAVTKQTYAYPAQLTLSLDTPLEFLE